MELKLTEAQFKLVQIAISEFLDWAGGIEGLESLVEETHKIVFEGIQDNPEYIKGLYKELNGRSNNNSLVF